MICNVCLAALPKLESFQLFIKPGDELKRKTPRPAIPTKARHEQRRAMTLHNPNVDHRLVQLWSG